MKKSLLTAPLVAAALIFGAACIMVMDPETSTSREPRGEFRKTVEFRAGGTLSLENDIGNVEISGWDKETVEVVAQGAAGKIGKERKVRAYGFWELKPDVEVKTTDGELTIRTRPYDGPGERPAVDYMIRVPNSVILRGIRLGEGNLTVSDVFGRLEATLDTGDLGVSNFSGSVDASVGTGDIDVEVLDLRGEDSVALSSAEGDIVLRLESGTSAVVEAEAPRGDVRSDLDLGVKTPASSVKGRMGEGGAEIKMKAGNGKIEILAIKDTIEGRKGKPWSI
jgi:hypothetical protein